MTQAQRKFKILLLGESAVGKTALLEQFMHGTFSTHAITLHFDVEIKTMEVGNRQVRLAIWDTGGQEKFRALSPAFFHGAKAAVLVYDVSRPESLEGLRDWVRLTYKYLDRIPMIVVGNKTDLLEAESTLRSRAERLAEEIGAFKHVHASAKSGEGVHKIFEDLVYEILFNAYARDDSHGPSVRPDNEPPQSAAGGCSC
ncbi:Ras- protein Rab-21 [Tulasnella sp. UAMH 9824]|nr:Ras- protein Rab-21 [Tulasnella sp. UAMH 9824]